MTTSGEPGGNPAFPAKEKPEFSLPPKQKPEFSLPPKEKPDFSIEFLWWDGCPSWPRALSELRDALEQAGLDPEVIETREILSDDEARQRDFVGSPTIRIDGRDVQPTGDEPLGLTCRLYRLRDGRVSPLPDPQDVRDALARAAASR